MITRKTTARAAAAFGRLRPLTASVMGATAGIALVATTATVAVPVEATAAPSAGPVYEGRGWDLMNERGLRSLGPGPFRIAFTDDDLAEQLLDVVAPVASQLTTITGTPFEVVADRVPLPEEGCAPVGTIVIGAEYRPLDREGYSWGGMCHSADRSLYSGQVKIDTEWLREGWFGDAERTDKHLRNGVAHEIGHAVGLEHPNTDRDGDGKAAPFECPLTPDGRRPLMCSPNGGREGDRAGQFTALDADGLRALVANHARTEAAA